MKKALFLLIAALLFSAVFSACGGAINPAGTEAPAGGGAPSTAEAVKLTVYLLGDGTKDDDMVFEKLNERTSDLINTTFERKLITWADFNTKYPLVFASGEDFDLIFTASWSFYAQQAVKDGFVELTDDLLSKCAPQIWDKLPDDAWKQARINGKVYMVPNTQKEYNHLGILVRGDLRKKYNVPEITSLEIFEEYLDAIAQNETGILPLDGGSEFDRWVLDAVWFSQPNAYRGVSVNGYGHLLTDPTGALIKTIDLPEYQAYLDRMVDYKERGYWGRNALNQQYSLVDNYKNGTSATAMHNVSTMVSAWRDTNKNHPEWEPEIYDSMFGTYPTVRTSYLGNGMGVHAGGKNTERSLMWLDTIRFNRECFDLMMYGIEGTHWIDAGEGLSTPGPSSGEYGGFSNWGFVTEQMNRRSTEEWPGFAPLLEAYDKRAVNCPPFYFLFDDSEVKNEVAAMTNINQKYQQMFDFGFDSDWRTTIQDVDKQYDDAGRQKVKELFEQQLAEFLESYNK